MKLQVFGWTFWVYKNNQSATERHRKLIRRRLRDGKCTVCARKVRKFNPQKKNLYRKCQRCRERENYLKKERREMQKVFS